MNSKREETKFLYFAAGICLFIAAAIAAVALILNFVPTYDTRYGNYNSAGEPYDLYLPDYVKVCNYKKIRLPNISYKPTEQDVANQLTNYQSMYCTSNEDPDRGAIKGDIVNIITECKYVDSGEEYGLFTFKKNSLDFGQAFVLGINYFGVPAIDEAVTGMKQDETKTVKIKLPDPFYKDILNSGREIELKIYLVYIDEINYQEATGSGDAFYEEYYGYGLEDFKIKINYDLQKKYTDMLSEYKNMLAWNYICDNSEMKKIPQDLVDDKYESLVDNARNKAIDGGKTLEEYVKSQGYDSLDDFYAYCKESSKQGVYEDMLLYYIIRCEGLTLPDDYYESELLEMAKDYQINELQAAEDFYDYYYGLNNVKEMILLKYAQQWVADNAEVVDDVTTVYDNNLGLKPAWQK